MKMNEEYAKKLLSQNQYYSIDDLRYNQKTGILLTKEELDTFLSVKDRLVEENYGAMRSLPLKTFNSKHCFFVNDRYMQTAVLEYLRILVADYETKRSYLFTRNAEDVAISRLYSEIEGSLDIENIPTTRKRIEEIHKSNSLTDENDIIIRNMLNAVSFIVTEKPAFTRDNLRKLYRILSDSCLAEDKKPKDGAYYRDDKVYIDIYEGAAPEIIDACMDSLFAFANSRENIEEYDILLPYICHYYILYVHPYFDYNGRTARMVSFWLSYIYDIAGAPLFMSEAINESKGDYYRAITNTRDTNNDLTYFLGYILETAIRYSFVYKNMEEIKNELQKTGDSLTPTEWGYVKKILVHNQDNYFNQKMFTEYIRAHLSKQGAMKILNNLERYRILEKAKNKKGEAIFRVNAQMLTYRFHQ